MCARTDRAQKAQAARSRPLVSVLVPTYNHEQYVESALDSIRDEGYPSLEILLIDDGSTDATWERVGAWEHANRGIATITAGRQSNAGLARTLNRLLERASGTYVTALASDDRLLPGGLAARVAVLQSRPDLLAVFADARVINAAGMVTREHALADASRKRLLADPVREIVANWSIPGPVLLYRREAVLELGGYADDLLVEDWDLYLRLAAQSAITYTDSVVAEYRWHGENAAASPALAARLADDLHATAWRCRSMFRGHLRLELIHESASWAARAAGLRRRWHAWVGWKATSIGMKLVASAVPRRPTDHGGPRPA